MDLYEYYSAENYMGQPSGAYIFRPITDSMATYGTGNQQTAQANIPIVERSEKPFVFATADSKYVL